MGLAGYLECFRTCPFGRLCGNDCNKVETEVKKYLQSKGVTTEVKVHANPMDAREVFARDKDGVKIAHVTSSYITIHNQ